MAIQRFAEAHVVSVKRAHCIMILMYGRAVQREPGKDPLPANKSGSRRSSSSRCRQMRGVHRTRGNRCVCAKLKLVSQQPLHAVVVLHTITTSIPSAPICNPNFRLPRRRTPARSTMIGAARRHAAPAFAPMMNPP